MKKTPLLILALVVVGAGGFVWAVRYAWNWSERFMKPIHTGMTMAEVRNHLGPPRAVRTYSGGIEVWDYRNGGHATHTCSLTPTKQFGLLTQIEQRPEPSAEPLIAPRQRGLNLETG